MKEILLLRNKDMMKLKPQLQQQQQQQRRNDKFIVIKLYLFKNIR
jgi:hypothetical protein